MKTQFFGSKNSLEHEGWRKKSYYMLEIVMTQMHKKEKEAMLWTDVKNETEENNCVGDRYMNNGKEHSTQETERRQATTSGTNAIES